ncbi:MAG TPA: OmpA family protein [Bacteroidia bacterium]|jgi:chemotaxis protein MotB|nr:OmpA family protein [Bacteroidia bacterium]
MKTSSYIIFPLLLTVALLSSCVSKKKYEEVRNGKAVMEQKYAQLEKYYEHLNEQNSQMEASLTNRETMLKAKEKTISEEEQKMRDMKAMVDAQKDAINNLHQEVCSALKCFTPDELKIEVRNGKLYVSMSDKLLFPSGSDQVNKRGSDAIAMLSAVLAHSDLEVMVEGHTDVVPIANGRNKDNWDLSVHRSTSVTRIMIDNGVKPERIIACGRGEFHPLASNSTDEGRQANRRTEIVLAPKLDKLWKLTEQPEDSKSTTLY